MNCGKDMFKNLQTAILFFVIYEGLILGSHSLDQSGFISLDCGLNENSTYTEETTKISYISDAAFVIGGERKSVSPEYSVNKQQQVLTLRSFPEGIRNCYTTSTKKGTKYLIRATFYYGNYDTKNSTPKFDLHLGSNFWDTIEFVNAGFPVLKEVIHFPARNYVHVCLVNTGSGTPFISALELRPVKNMTYVTQADDSLRLIARYDTGSTTNRSYRYPFDVFDRLWNEYNNPKWSILSTSETVDLVDQNDFQPPNIVMKNAGTPANESAPMEFIFYSEDINIAYYLYMHFAEIEHLKPNESRVFNINVNGRLLYGPVTPDYLNPETVFLKKPLSGGSRYVLTLNRLTNSSLPPILNAFEIYERVFFSSLDTDEIDVDAIGNVKSVYGVKRNWDGDPCLPVNYLWTGLSCSADGSTASRITSLNLSSSGLSGEIATSVGDLNLLESLDFSNNNLTGPVPQFLTQLPNLRVLNLRKNNLSGLVPDELVQRFKRGSLLLSIEENQDLCSSSPCDQKNTKKKKSVVAPIALSVGGSLLLLALGVVVFMVFKKKKKQGAQKTEKYTEIASLETKNRQFTYPEIVKMTRNFERVLGRGGFGTVYYGVLADGTEVAVKLGHTPQAGTASTIHSQELERRKEFEAEQQYQLFLAEVKLLLTVYHGKLTSLVGYCNQGINRALIYEFMANGDLESHLSGKQGRVLSWEMRLKIAIDSAQGLEYLHSGCKPPIIHRDIKTANILISENFQAKLADFGLSKFFLTEDGTHVSTMHIVGTPGYLDPDLANNGLLNEKSDVYSFGVVLLRIITGRPVIRDTQENMFHLSQWVCSMLESGNINDIVDPKLRGVFKASSAWKIVEIAMSCVSFSSTERPNMSHVVTELRECLALELLRTKYSFAANSGYSKPESLNLDMVSDSLPLAR